MKIKADAIYSIRVIFILSAIMAMTGCATDVNRADGTSTTPLMWATQAGDIGKVKSLVAQGADLNARNRNGVSVLYHAIYYKHVEVARYLIANGARPANENERVQIDAMLGISIANQSVAEKSSVSTPKSDVDELPLIKTKANKNSYAIVIGIENYRQKLPKADYAVADAKIISQYLTKTMGYPEENVITLLNDRALKSDMEKFFDRWLSNNVEENGRVFIYYSGHGAPNTQTADAYLVPYDGDPTFIAETGYSIARLYESLGKLKAKEITVVIDSCFSGAGGRSVLAKGAKPLVMTINMPTMRKNISVMTASSGDQISSAYEEQGHGLFTYFLLKGIKDEDVIKPDGSIKMDTLFGYIKPQVERIARKQYNNEQTPQLIGAKTK